MKHIITVLWCTLLLLAAACTPSPEPINYGKEACAHCKMTIIDNRFGAELLTSKGKIYKFDDIVCLRHFEGEHPELKNNKIFVSDYLQQNKDLLKADEAVFLKHEFFRSPMNGQYGAFASAAEAKYISDSLNITVLTLDQVN